MKSVFSFFYFWFTLNNTKLSVLGFDTKTVKETKFSQIHGDTFLYDRKKPAARHQSHQVFDNYSVETPKFVPYHKNRPKKKLRQVEFCDDSTVVELLQKSKHYSPGETKEQSKPFSSFQTNRSNIFQIAGIIAVFTVYTLGWLYYRHTLVSNSSKQNAEINLLQEKLKAKEKEMASLDSETRNEIKKLEEEKKNLDVELEKKKNEARQKSLVQSASEAKRAEYLKKFFEKVFKTKHSPVIPIAINYINEPDNPSLTAQLQSATA